MRGRIAARPINPDDISSQIGEEHRAKWCGAQARELDNAHALKRTHLQA